MKKNVKRLIGIIMIICMLVPYNLSVYASENVNYDINLEDVKDYYPFNSWAVDTAKKYSFIFLEDNRRETTRVEVANIIYNIADIKGTKNKSSFKDVDGLSDKEKNAIEAVANAGIIKGYTDGTFCPYKSVTRAEFVTILDRAGLLNNSNLERNINFNDTANHWATDSIIKSAKLNIVTGRGENNFCPEETITPQEILVILDRLVDKKTINKNQLLQSLLNTFKCKVYDENEKFIVEEIYSKFDEVQNEMKYSWPYEDFYDPSDWQTLATYEDLQYALFFSMTSYSATNYKEEAKKTYDKYIISSYMMQGIEPDNEKNGKNNILLKHIIRGYKCAFSNDSYALAYNYEAPYNPYIEFDYSIFDNQLDFSKEDKASLGYFINRFEEINAKNYSYMPLDAPVTKYMLNYFICKIRADSHWKYYMVSNSYDAKVELELETKNMPSNYKEYPYIIKGIPKEVYEMESGYARINDIKYAPKETFVYKYGDDMANIVERTNAYYNTYLNIDYNTINFDELSTINRGNAYFCDSEALSWYVQHVKDNEIIIKGKATAVPGAIFIYGTSAYIRVIFDFEIVNSKTNKNLLYGDTRNIKLTDVVYEKNKYYFVADVKLTAALNMDSEDVEFIRYAPVHRCIYEYAYPEYQDYIMK